MAEAEKAIADRNQTWVAPVLRVYSISELTRNGKYSCTDSDFGLQKFPVGQPSCPTP